MEPETIKTVTTLTPVAFPVVTTIGKMILSLKQSKVEKLKEQLAERTIEVVILNADKKLLLHEKQADAEKIQSLNEQNLKLEQQQEDSKTQIESLKHQQQLDALDKHFLTLDNQLLLQQYSDPDDNYYKFDIQKNLLNIIIVIIIMGGVLWLLFFLFKKQD